MSGKTKHVQDPEIAISDLSKADGILQRQSMVACKPNMSRPVPLLRRGEAIKDDEGGSWILYVQGVDQPQPQLEFLRIGGTIVALSQCNCDDEPPRQRQLQEVISTFASIWE